MGEGGQLAARSGADRAAEGPAGDSGRQAWRRGQHRAGLRARRLRSLGADAVTVHPYLGYDSVAPFLAHKDKEVFIVCRTSNPGATEFQHLRSEGEALYRHVARAAVRWDHHDNVGLVVGATAPAELRDVRQIAGDRLLLVPGV